MWVKNYMFCKISTISPDTTIAEAVKRMVEERTNSMIVVDSENKPIGTLSSYTLVREVVPAYLKDDPMFSQFGKEGIFDKYAEKMKDRTVKDLMHTDFHILSEDDAMIEAASYSIKASRRILPVVDKEGKLVGATTRTCIKNALYNAIYKENMIKPDNGGCCSCNEKVYKKD
jgi:predicted transcriptional regulator